jgi:hypothetical protein
MVEAEGDSGQLDVFTLLDGDVRAWVDQDSIMLKAKDGKFDDPVELTPKEARRLAAALEEFARRAE